MFNLFHPERLIVVGSSSSQQICEETVTGKNQGKEREHDIRCQEVQKPPRHFIMERYQLQRDTGDNETDTHWVFFARSFFVIKIDPKNGVRLFQNGLDGKHVDDTLDSDQY